MTTAAKIIISVLSVFTAIAIIFGVYIHFFSGISFGSSRRVVSGSIAPEGEITSLTVDAAIGDVRIKTGSDFSVDYNIYEQLVPTVTVDDGVLKVKSEAERLNLTGINLPKDLYIIITIPEDFRFEKVSLDLDAGNMNIKNLSADSLRLDVDAGNIKMEDVEAGEVTADVDAANFEVTDLTTDRFTVDIDAGNLDIRDSYIDYIYADVDMGNVESHNCTINSGECDVDLGNISLRGEIGSVTSHTSLGNSSAD